MVRILDRELETLLNEQANLELQASYKYLSASFKANELDLNRIEKFLLEQSAEERLHALDFYAFIQKKNGKAVFRPVEIDLPKMESPEDIFKFAYDSEILVSEKINNIIEKANAKDPEVAIFLMDYAKKQTEEIDIALGNLKMAKDFGKEKINCRFLDREFD
ncbi:hypothetical protein MHBO_003480 [Bonamia ostreae]|uniref:Ferritin n=1 Tax=Bonamia ostreae TaxID=126728 RepID=A0ABV2AQK7_9EUKA